MSIKKYYCFKYINTEDNSILDFQVDIKKFRFESTIIKKIIYNSIASGFKHRVFSISDTKGLVHFSFVIGKCGKFRFLHKNDYVIGPCWTREDRRGEGLYAKMINYIGRYLTENDIDTNVYILINEANNISLKGVKKSAYHKVGYVERSKQLRIYSNIIEQLK